MEGWPTGAPMLHGRRCSLELRYKQPRVLLNEEFESNQAMLPAAAPVVFSIESIVVTIPRGPRDLTGEGLTREGDFPLNIGDLGSGEKQVVEILPVSGGPATS